MSGSTLTRTSQASASTDPRARNRLDGCTTSGTCAPQPSLLSGVPVHVVVARLGHADPAVTLRVYAHVIRSAEAAAAHIYAQAVKAA
jgi:hypothetical protein